MKISFKNWTCYLHCSVHHFHVNNNHLYFIVFDRDLKIVILGDASVGKTSLIQRYLQGVFTGDTVSVRMLN